jgi:RNA ligase (TIGR02306 family)
MKRKWYEHLFKWLFGRFPGDPVPLVPSHDTPIYENATATVVEGKSTHKVEVVEVKLEPHDNADTLSIVRVDNYVVCVRSSDWSDGDLGAYIPPDSLVPLDHPSFAFLQVDEGKTQHRVKAKRLRGVMSMGLLVPAPEGSQIGEDVAEILGVEHYEPKVSQQVTMGLAEKDPTGREIPKYDVDTAYKYAKRLLTEGEPLWISEKIHGANSRFIWTQGRMWCGSQKQWKSPNHPSTFRS